MMNHKKLFGLMAQHLQVKSFLQNAEKLYSYEQYSRYPDFEKSAQFCVEALQKAGFSDVESIPVPCDGVTSYMDHTMPQAWDRTGRCTLEILDQAVPEEFRMLCDSDRHPLEAGIWSPPTAPEGLTGEVVDGDAAGENADAVRGKFVYTSEPPKNKLMIAWSKAGALGVICTKMEAADVAPDELCWMNGVGHYGWYYSKDDKRIPVFVLTPNRAEYLTKLMQSAPVRVKGVMNTRIYDGTLPVITGRIPGESPEELLLIAHIYEPFIADDAIGFAGSVEIGRLLKELNDMKKIRLKRSLRVVFMMERYGLFAFLSDKKRCKNIFAAQNMDAFCSKTYSIGGMPLTFFMSPVCNPFFSDVLQKEMLEKLLPDIRINRRHSVLHDDSLAGDPDLDIPTLWIEEGTGKYHHNKTAAFNEIDEELAPRLLALLSAYSAEMLCAGMAEMKKVTMPLILKFYREQIREIRNACKNKVIAPKEAAIRLKIARHFAEGRLRSLNKLQPGIITDTEIASAVEPIAAIWHAPEVILPDLTAWEAKADNMILKRCQKGCIPFSLARVPMEEKILWPCATNRPILPLSDGKRSLLEAMQMQRYTENIPVKPFTKADFQMYISFAEYLKKYGYVTIRRPRKTTVRQFSAALKKLGVKPGMQMIVHTGMSGFGHFEGGALEYCRTLQNAVGENGTLMMPAFNEYDMSSTGGVFDWRKTISKVGAASECFRTMPGVIRSLDPTHSVAVWGKDKFDFVKHHHQLPTMDQESPIGLLEKADGYCLMAGCYTSVTFRHVVEASNGAKCCGEREEEYGAILPDGSGAKLRAWAWMDGSCRAIRHEEIYDWLRKNGKMTETKVGNACLKLFKLADYRKAYERLLKGKNGCDGCTVRPRKNEFSTLSDWDKDNRCLKGSAAFSGDVDFEKFI